MGTSKLYGLGAAIVIFIVLMIVTPAIPQSQEYHDFADQRELFLGKKRLSLMLGFLSPLGWLISRVLLSSRLQYFDIFYN